jgi:chromosome partitioning protein
MHVVALCSHKGGSGKTTLAGHLAVQAELAGAGPVGLVDSDPLGSLAAWRQARDGATPAFAATTLARLTADLERLRLEGCKLVFIDTPPAINVALQRAIDVAELVIVPVRPSPHDLRATAGTVEMVERAERRTLFVLNGVDLRAEITSEAVVALSERGTVAPVLIQQRTDLATSMIDGRTVCETDPEGSSAKEVSGLWEYLAVQLEKQERRRVFQKPAALGFGRRAGL